MFKIKEILMEEFNSIIDFIVKQESKKTVGILLKRIELFVEEAKKNNKDSISFKELELLKAEQKEIIYEAYRNIRDFLNTTKLILINADEAKKKSEEKNG